MLSDITRQHDADFNFSDERCNLCVLFPVQASGAIIGISNDFEAFNKSCLLFKPQT